MLDMKRGGQMIYTYGYIFYIPITLIFITPFIIMGVVNKRPIAYYLFVGIFVIYLNMAIKIAFFPLIIEDISGFDYIYNIKFSLNLFEASKIHLLLNVLLTLPIGIGLQFITNLTIKGRLVVAVLSGMSFEMIQLIILVLFKPINIFFDANDLFCNITGVLIGLLVIHFVNIFLKKKSISSKNSFIVYIKNVCINSANKKKSLEF